MFTSSDPNLTDLDFELVDELQHNQFINESMIKDLLSTSSPASTSSAYRIVKPMYTKKTYFSSKYKYFDVFFFFFVEVQTNGVEQFNYEDN